MTDKKEDHVLPEGKWEFDENVTNVFGNMLQRSIPQYEVMREAATDIVCKFVKNGDLIIDIGCSDGMAIEHLWQKLGARCRYRGIDVSEPMLEKARERFKGSTYVTIENMDLRWNFPDVHAGAVQSILTLCFIPIEYRQSVIARCYQQIKDGGVFVVVEKMLGETAVLDELYVEKYLNMKRQHGYSEDEIWRKRLALEGVMMPLTAKWNQQMLKDAGFRYVDCFWRWMNFGGFVAVK